LRSLGHLVELLLCDAGIVAHLLDTLIELVSVLEVSVEEASCMDSTARALEQFLQGLSTLRRSHLAELVVHLIKDLGQRNELALHVLDVDAHLLETLDRLRMRDRVHCAGCRCSSHSSAQTISGHERKHRT